MMSINTGDNDLESQWALKSQWHISDLSLINSKSITAHNSGEFLEIYISTVDNILNDIDCHLIIILEVVGDSLKMLL